jgi:hypothetical protein
MFVSPTLPREIAASSLSDRVNPVVVHEKWDYNAAPGAKARAKTQIIFVHPDNLMRLFSLTEAGGFGTYRIQVSKAKLLSPFLDPQGGL